MTLTADFAADAAPVTQAAPDRIVVWSKPSCVQCTATYRRLDALGVDYVVHDLTQDLDALEAFKAQGFLQAPILQGPTLEHPEGETWSGYRPDLIDQASQLVTAGAIAA